MYICVSRASKGLKYKYRGEVEREEAWLSWISANEYAEGLFDRGEVK
jgi:hypothetical protein